MVPQDLSFTNRRAQRLTPRNMPSYDPVGGSLSYRVMCEIGVAVIAVVSGHLRDLEGPEAPSYILRCLSAAMGTDEVLRMALWSLKTSDNDCTSLNDEGDLTALAHIAKSSKPPVLTPCMPSSSYVV